MVKHTFSIHPVLTLFLLFLPSTTLWAQDEPEEHRTYLLEVTEQHAQPMDSLFESIELVDQRGNPLHRDRLTFEHQVMLFGAAMSVKSMLAVDKDQDVADIDLRCTFGDGLLYCEIPGYFCTLSIQQGSLSGGCSACDVPGKPHCVPDFLWP